MIILGAGLSGLIAGCMFPLAKIIESSKKEDYFSNSHKALLRFRTSAVGDALGI